MRILGVIAVLALALTACGTGGDGGTGVASAPGTKATAGSTTGPSLSPEERGVKWAQCMRENGIDIEDPKPGGGIMMTAKPGSEGTMDKAREACKDLQPMGRGGGGNPQNAEKMRQLAQCMRDNGVEEFPDPEGGGLRMTKQVADDPDFEAAREKCQMNNVMGGS
jgi:hypothetical protein